MSELTVTEGRAAVRRRFEERWTARRMAQDYLDVYARLGKPAPPQSAGEGDEHHMTGGTSA